MVHLQLQQQVAEVVPSTNFDTDPDFGEIVFVVNSHADYLRFDTDVDYGTITAPKSVTSQSEVLHNGTHNVLDKIPGEILATVNEETVVSIGLPIGTGSPTITLISGSLPQGLRLKITIL